MKSHYKYFMSLMFLIINIHINADIISVCSAENQYGSVAELIGGECVSVANIISSIEMNPHIFNISARNKVTNSQVIIYNGSNYDSWINRLISDQSSEVKHIVINVSEISDIRKGENPHIWYKPEVYLKLAKVLCERFSEIQPLKKGYFEDNLKSFNSRYSEVTQLISAIKSKHVGTTVIATEPLFDYMSDALGFDMMGDNIQWMIANAYEPSPKMTDDFLRLIKKKKVKILFNNKQVINTTSKHLIEIARQNNIPVIGISETMPQNVDVIEWLLTILREIEMTLKITK